MKRSGNQIKEEQQNKKYIHKNEEKFGNKIEKINVNKINRFETQKHIE